MKLKEIMEANPYKVTQSDPSGLAQSHMDPSEIGYSTKEPDRTKRLRARLRVTKKTRKGRMPSPTVVNDNIDTTDAGAHSAVNAPFTY
jgi:hypothetical protein